MKSFELHIPALSKPENQPNWQPSPYAGMPALFPGGIVSAGIDA